MNERRAQPRVTLSGELRGTVKSSIAVRVLDLSEGGIRIQSGTGLSPGTDCTLSLDTGDGQLRLRAHVLRCRACLQDGRMCYASGLQFQEDEQTHQTVRALLESLRGSREGRASGFEVASALDGLEEAVGGSVH